MSENQDKKVVLITGSSRGIGAEIAREFHAKGYAVAIHYFKGEEEALKISSELNGSKIFKADLSVEAECEDLIKNVKQAFSRIDVLINNAGRTIDQALVFAKTSDFDTLIQTNVKPVFLLSKLVTKLMIRQKTGAIVNISSVVGFTGNAGQTIYSATKGAITAMTKSMALELSHFGIRVNSIAPGFIETEMTKGLSEEIRSSLLAKIPLKRLGTPKEIAKAACFLASEEEASYITGTTLHVNGGMLTT